MTPQTHAREIVEQWQRLCHTHGFSPMRGYGALGDLIETVLAEKDAEIERLTNLVNIEIDGGHELIKESDALRAQRDSLVTALEMLHPEVRGHEGWTRCQFCAALAAWTEGRE